MLQESNRLPSRVMQEIWVDRDPPIGRFKALGMAIVGVRKEVVLALPTVMCSDSVCSNRPHAASVDIPSSCAEIYQRSEARHLLPIERRDM